MGVTLSYSGLGGKVKFSGTSGKFKTVYTKPSLFSLYPGAAAAYSLRKLDGAYTGSAIRVSRDFDLAESNIGFDSSGNLDTTALALFVLGSNGRVVTWYDQSGNGRNAINATPLNAPFIRLNGTTYTLNGKPSIYYDNGGQYLITSNFASAISQPISTYTVSKVEAINVNASVIYDSSTTTGFALLHGGNTEPSPLNLSLGINSGASIGIESTVVATELVSVLWNSANTNAFVNGVQKVTNQNPGSNSLGGVTIGNLRPLGFYNVYSFYGYISELIFYPSLQTANNTGIQNNINSYYTIY